MGNRTAALAIALFAAAAGAGTWFVLDRRMEAAQAPVAPPAAVAQAPAPTAPADGPAPAAAPEPEAPAAAPAPPAATRTDRPAAPPRGSAQANDTHVMSAGAVEEVEPSDSEPVIDKILPRRSAGHARGLHKAPDALGLDVSAAFVVDARTRQVVFAKNEEAMLPMASITKLMTGLLIAESRLPMNETLTITEDDVDELLHSRSRLRVGTVLTRDEALRLALMSSENRAAHALGRTWPGGLQAFVRAMNLRAAQLGMTNTTYHDPTGLSSANQSSARDLSALVIAASRHPLLRQYSTTQQHLFDAGGRKALRYVNSNRLVRGGRWDIDLQKTGYIVEAGHCVVMLARIANRDLVMVLLDAPDNAARVADAERIRRWLDPETARNEARAAREARTASARQAKPAARAKRVVRQFAQR